MGHCCSKGVTADNDGHVVAVVDGNSAVSTNNRRKPSPSPARPQSVGNGTSYTNNNTPAHSFTTSPFQSPYPAGIPPSPSPVGTPRRKFKWPFPPPSPAKPILSAILKRQGTTSAKPKEGPIPEDEGGEGERQLDKSFGYPKNLTAKYELGKEVGRGHFGHTCWAKGKKGELKNQPVAVKIISKSKMTTAISIEDVRREVKILKALSGHQNLVKFYDAFEDANNVYIVMELCEGGELLDRILSRGGRYTEEDAKSILVQILNVVAFCHLQGVVHRDLKPENFLFTKKEEDAPMKVIDFGLSDFIRPDQRLNDIVGSAYYVAPEVLHRSYSIEADMWSIGVITYILLCGSRPFWARTESGIFRSVLRADPNFEDSPWPSVSAEARDFVKRLLNKDHRKRMTASQALAHPWLRTGNPVLPLDILIFKLVKSYTRASPLKRAALKALSKALTEEELIYLRAQFNLLEPKDGRVSLNNFKMALTKQMTDAMTESRVFDILNLMEPLSYKPLDFEEFCAAAISTYQLEALENWEQIACAAFEYFEQEGNRIISVEELAQEMNLGPTAYAFLKDCIRPSDRKLSFLGYTKYLHGVTIRGSSTRHHR
ncbi:CDPK-related kinase 4 [Nicotiana tabacum]|uniref:CDPK-related kinase 4 n=1 Tax=Nicotiana tabacum TaxID=4097 RepID=A0AC58UEV1_TOBAC